MRKIFSLLICLCLSMAVYAQGKVSFADTDKIETARSTGVYHFEFDKSFTIEDIEKAKSYYAQYFTVSTMDTEKSIYVTVRFVDDSEIARRVLQRFFSSLKVQEINVSGTDVKVMPFLEKFVL